MRAPIGVKYADVILEHSLIIYWKFFTLTIVSQDVSTVVNFTVVFAPEGRQSVGGY